MENQINQEIASDFSKPKSTWKTQLAIFIAIFAVLFSARATQIYDSQFVFLLSYSIYNDQNLDLRPYLDYPGLRDDVKRLMPVNIYTKEVEGNTEWRFGYPNISAVLSIPYVFLMDKLGYSVVVGNPLQWWLANETILQKIYCALLAAIYGLILWRIARLWLDVRIATLIVILLVFGSSVSSTLSRALWADTYANLFLLMTIYHLAKASVVKFAKKDFNIVILILTLGISVLAKPTYAIPAVAMVGWAFLINRRKTLGLIIGALSLVIAGGVYNYFTYGSFMGIYQTGDFLGFEWQRFFGLLISPGRGMFVYWTWCFFIIVLLITMYKKISSFEKLIIALNIFPLIATVIMLSFFWFWHGGPGYGPRLLLPAMPGLFLILILLFSKFVNPIIEEYNIKNSQNDDDKQDNKGLSLSGKNQLIISLGFLTALIAIMLNMYGANQNKAHDAWYRMELLEGETFDTRMWNWRDPPFLAGYIKPERYFKYTIQLESAPSSLDDIPTAGDVQKKLRKYLEEK